MKAVLVVVITLILVVLLNLAIYFLATRRGRWSEFELFRRAGEGARSPWAQEDKHLSELSRRVEGLKGSPAPQEKPPHE